MEFYQDLLSQVGDWLANRVDPMMNRFDKEGAGKVVAIGNNVNHIKIGDRVAYAAPPLGAYCEIRDFPANKIIKIPDFISNDEVASILLQGMTVEYLIERLYKIKKNEII